MPQRQIQRGTKGDDDIGEQHECEQKRSVAVRSIKRPQYSIAKNDREDPSKLSAKKA